MHEVQVQRLFVEAGAAWLDKGCWFVSTNTDEATGLHHVLLDGYVNCDPILPDGSATARMTEALMRRLAGRRVWANAYVSASGGESVMVHDARWLSQTVNSTSAVSIVADKRGASYVIERPGHAEALAGKRVVVFNDRIVTGGTTLKVIEAVRACGGEVVAVGTWCGVDGVDETTFDVPVYVQLTTINVGAHSWNADNSWSPADRSVPICVDEALGHGAAFARENPNWDAGFVSFLRQPGATVQVDPSELCAA